MVSRWTWAVSAVAAGLAGVLALRLAGAPPDAGTVPGATARGADTARVTIEGEAFDLELALDPETRFRGLSGRRTLARNGGMLFVNRDERPRGMVMRHCSFPIDVAFLDHTGRVVAIHSMWPERPQQPAESAEDYEARLPVHRSDRVAQFALEVAGGRLAELGLRVGERVEFDRQGLVARAR